MPMYIIDGMKERTFCLLFMLYKVHRRILFWFCNFDRLFYLFSRVLKFNISVCLYNFILNVVMCHIVQGGSI